jgi:hypothetical protein
MVDGVGTSGYGCTSAGLLASEDGPWTDDTVNYTYSYQRQRNGLSVLAPNAAPWAQTYGYDSAERLNHPHSVKYLSCAKNQIPISLWTID